MQNTASVLHRVVGSPVARRDTDRQSPVVSWNDGLPTLTGKLVTLRELVAADGSVLLPLVTAPEVARFLSPPPQSLERFAGFIESTLRERRAGLDVGGEEVAHVRVRCPAELCAVQSRPSFHR